MSYAEYPCGMCSAEVKDDSIECSLCQKWIHRICAKLSIEQLNCKSNNNNDWYCANCKDIFPFHNINNIDFRFTNTNQNLDEKLLKIYEKCTKLNFEPFNISNYNYCDFENEIDPNNNFYKNVSRNCKYLMVNECNCGQTINKQISFIHFNARNIKVNFDKIENLINDINIKFDIIAISETWLEPGDSQDALLRLDGYTMSHMERENRKGGGVAIYVSNSLDYRVINCMSVRINGVMECVTVELCINKRKNIIVNCVYRTPGSDMQTFIDQIETVIKNVKNVKKSIFLCGDLNIDLLKYNDNTPTKNFVDMMFSLGLYPLLDKPTRITDHSATLIDNIFTNELDSKINSGLLISDISDHLPIFAVCKYPDINRISNQKYTLIRQTDKNCIDALKNELLLQNWNDVMGSTDVNIAYDNFIKTFVNLYDKHCPVKKICSNVNGNKIKPWFTTGLRNACKKKNNLYRKFLQCRTKSAEERYKVYKNKLTTILRNSEKIYYSTLLDKEKNNIKGTWKILNTIIRKGQHSSPLPDKFMSNGKTVTHKKDIANGFNDFFVNVGPNLAKDINIPNENTHVLDYLNSQNPESMFLASVEESEVINIVRNCKNKKSTGYDGIDMTIIKQVIYHIIKPFTHICNNSFENGVFPSKMKIAKVVPIFKAGDKSSFNNYRPISLLPQFSKIVEKLFNARLDAFLEKHDTLTSSQYGFRSNMSTSLALLELTEEITSALDHKKVPLVYLLTSKRPSTQSTMAYY